MLFPNRVELLARRVLIPVGVHSNKTSIPARASRRLPPSSRETITLRGFASRTFTRASRTFDAALTREFLRAVDRYRRECKRPWPTATELLQIAVSLGYRKVAPAGPLPGAK